MNASDSLRAGLRVLTTRPGDVLPVYLLAGSATLVARAIGYVGAALAVAVLVAQDRLRPAIDAFRGIDVEDAAALERAFETAADLVVTPTTVAIGVGTVLVATAVLVVARALASALALGGVYGRLQDRDPVRAAVRDVRRYGFRFVGLALVRGLLLVAIAVLVGGAAVVLAPLGAAGALLAVLLGLFGTAVALLVLVLFAFAGQAVVVEGAGVWGAIRRSAGFPLRRPRGFLAYLGVVAVATVGLAVLAVLLALFSMSRVAGLVGVALVPPVVDGFKTALYAEDVTVPTVDTGRSTGTRFVGAFRDGWRALVDFVAGHPLAVVASGLFLVAGVVLGWLATSPFGVQQGIPEDVALTFGATPQTAFVQLAANNWLVAVETAYGGVALGLPSAANLAFNGVVIGLVAGVFDPVDILALVAPHGIVELPAIVFAGALGLHLGAVTWRRVRGRADDAAVARALRRAYEVLLGLVLLFLLAAGIEAFVTPLVGAAVGAA